MRIRSHLGDVIFALAITLFPYVLSNTIFDHRHHICREGVDNDLPNFFGYNGTKDFIKFGLA